MCVVPRIHDGHTKPTAFIVFVSVSGKFVWPNPTCISSSSMNLSYDFSSLQFPTKYERKRTNEEVLGG